MKAGTKMQFRLEVVLDADCNIAEMIEDMEWQLSHCGFIKERKIVRHRSANLYSRKKP